jgi:hypothetical protein
VQAEPLHGHAKHPHTDQRRYQRIALGPLVIVLIRLVADDRQDFDEAERGLQSPQSHSGHTVTLYSLVRIGTRPG